MQPSIRRVFKLGAAFGAAVVASNLLTRDILDKANIQSIVAGARREVIIADCTRQVMNPISDSELLRIRGANLIPAVQNCVHQQQIDEVREIAERGHLAKMFQIDWSNAPLAGALALGLALMGARRGSITRQP